MNGNLKKDSRRGLEYDYNSLNLLSEVRRDGQPAAKYDWLADGTKLGVRDVGGENGFVYAGSLTYHRSADGLKLETAHFGDGVIRVNENGTQAVDYFICDHLGSVRMIVDSAGAVKERNDYYPFGARHVRSDYALSTNRWKYNGKELQTTGDLGFLDYGARMYDMSVGRWFGMDPLTEEYTGLSGYVFSGNNPLILVDADGQYFDWYQNAAGTAMLWKDSKEEELFLNGEVYNNVGSSMSLEVDGLYFNYYQNILASTSSEPLNGMESVLSNPSLLPKLLGSNSALSETYQLELLVRSMHSAQDAFLNHPVTRKTVEALTFIAGGGIESVSMLCRLGKLGVASLNRNFVKQFASFKTWFKSGGKTFEQYKASRGGSKILGELPASTGTQIIRTEYHHMFITQRMQRRYNLPNWMVNNRLNVYKLNTVQHALLDSYRFRFLRKGLKSDVGWFKKYNWFAKYPLN